MQTRLVMILGLVISMTGIAVAAPAFRVSAMGGNSCGFWGSGFSRVDSHPVSDSQSFFDSLHPSTFRYTASSGCGDLFIHTEIDWACGCGSLCGENNGLTQMVLDDVVFSGPAGATTANFRINLDLSVPTMASFGAGSWRLYSYAVAFNQAFIDTGDQSGTLGTTRVVSSMGSWALNQPVTFYVRLTTGIRAADQTPSARGDAIVSFPTDMPVFSFFDANGNPVTGFSAHSSGFTCPRGDMNCDQVVNLADVPDFALALLAPSGVNLCSAPSADMNLDGLVDGRDIGGFVNCVLGGGCP